MGGGGRVGGGGGLRVDVKEELKFLRKLKKKFGGGEGGEGQGGGVGLGGQGRCEQRSEVFCEK